MVAPHRRDIPEIWRHALAIHHKGEVGWEKMLAEPVAVQARNVSKRVHDLVRQAVKEKIDKSRERARRLPPAFPLLEFIKERTKVGIMFEVDRAKRLTRLDNCVLHSIGGKPASYLAFIDLEVQGLVALLCHIDGPATVWQLGKGI